jgi:type VI secretion system protein ImpK
MLNKNEDASLAKFNNVIAAPAEQAHITILLP